jgi:hypothetical protein
MQGILSSETLVTTFNSQQPYLPNSAFGLICEQNTGNLMQHEQYEMTATPQVTTST